MTKKSLMSESYFCAYCNKVNSNQENCTCTKARLEYIRQQIKKECISQGEIAELQGLKEHIESGDTLLLEWAGVPEA